MTKIFEDEFTEWQVDMVDIAKEFCEDKVDKTYLYGSIEGGSYFFNLFFEVKNRIVLMNDLNSILSEKEKIDACDENQWSVLRIGVENLEKIKIVCDKYGKPTPTQLKLVYTVQKNQLQMKYKYDLVYSNVQDLDTHEIFMSWYEEVKKEVEG